MNYLRRTAVGMLKLSGLYHPLRDLRRDLRFQEQSRESIRKWRAEGCPLPPPDAVKYACIRSLAELHASQILVETGTFYGNAIFSLRHTFREIHSIELAPSLHARCVQDMGHLKHIHLHLGDSAKELPRIALGLDAPALFWLDGHFCSGPSARGERKHLYSRNLHFYSADPPVEMSCLSTMPVFSLA